MAHNHKECVFCKNQFNSYSIVCDECVEKKYFVSHYEMRKYQFIPSELKQLTSYYLHNKIEDDYKNGYRSNYNPN